MKKKRVIVVNLFGGPGAGKSTQRADVFQKLKKAGINVEEVMEYAKKLTWQKAIKKLKNQLYIFAKQHNDVWQLLEEVEVIVTDSPILLSVLYGRYYKTITNPHFTPMACWEFEQNDNINVYLDRPKYFQAEGRNQDLKGALVVDQMLKDMMVEFNYNFDLVLNVDEVNAGEVIFQAVLTKLKACQ